LISDRQRNGWHPSASGPWILFDRLREKKHQTGEGKSVAMSFDLATYYPIFLYLLFIAVFAGTTLILAHVIGPKRKTPVKLMTYESGMDPIGDARQHYDVKFYLIAILFLVFDVELLFLYPWAVIAYREGALPPELLRLIFWEILVFTATLAVAYVYAWRKGVFQWR
jgi:NADH:ubiquinone oxidoreductase subunit 3 (subunit A)